MVVKVNKR